MIFKQKKYGFKMMGVKLLCKFLVGEIDGYEIDGAKLMKKDKKPDKTRQNHPWTKPLF